MWLEWAFKDDIEVGIGLLSTLSLAVEDLDSEQGGLLSDTVGSRADSASDVGAVESTIGIFTITIEVLKLGSTTLEFLSHG